VKKIISIALLLVTAVATLSACKLDEVSTAADGGGYTPYAAKVGDGAQGAVAQNQPGAPAKPNAPAKPKYTFAQQNAIAAAKDYLSMSGMSKAGLIQQLDSKYGEGYSKSDAVFAVNHITVNWNEQAVRAAKDYLEMSSFSRASLIQQLCSKAGDGFTLAQATYAADHVGY
jgi:hypothetical protein